MKTEKTVAPAAIAAAEWWAEQVGCPTFRNMSGSEPPQERAMGDFAGLMAGLVAERHPVSADSAEKFVQELAARIEPGLTRSYGVTLSVDYGPDPELAEAATAAGVDLSRFPWKTCMWVHHDHVTASLGYRAPTRLVWSAPDWVRPVCGAHHYSDDGADAWDETCGLPMYHESEHGDWKPDTRVCEHEGCGKPWSAHRKWIGHTLTVDGREQW